MPTLSAPCPQCNESLLFDTAEPVLLVFCPHCRTTWLRDEKGEEDEGIVMAGPAAGKRLKLPPEWNPNRSVVSPSAARSKRSARRTSDNTP